jgi:heat shock protein HspQ
VIIYHNIKKYTHQEVYHDIWENTEEPYISNESEVYIKLELDAEAVEKVKQDEITNKNIGIQNNGLASDSSQEQLDGGEENKEGEEANATNRSTEKLPLPGE